MEIVICLLVTGLIGVIIFRRQNSAPRLGGPIAASKALWLYWTIAIWFFLLPYALLTHQWPRAMSYGWTWLTLSMWVRGVAEIYMLFISKNWTPKIGITHDIVTCAVLVLIYVLEHESFLAANWWTQHFALAMVYSLIVETYYAYAFLRLVREKTKGEKAIWYASKEDPQFRRLLQLTTTFNCVLYTSAVIFIYGWKFKYG